LTALDTGNALRTQVRPEVATLVNLFRYFSGVTGEVKGTVLPAGDDQLQYTRREPATASCMRRPKPGISGVESPRRPVERFSELLHCVTNSKELVNFVFRHPQARSRGRL
jgi:hypothetical protein